MKILKFYTIIITGLLIIGLLGCSKESTTTQVKGFVADATNLNRLAGATVFLKKQNTSCFSCQGSTIDVTTADNNGNYSFDFEHEKGFTYSLTASHNNYWDILPGYFYIDKGEENTKILTMSPKAYLRVFIKNTSPYDGNDVIATGSFGGGGDFFYGATVDTTIVKTTSGNQEIKVVFHVTKNNVTTTISNNVYTPAFDTTNLTINY